MDGSIKTTDVFTHLAPYVPAKYITSNVFWELLEHIFPALCNFIIGYGFNTVDKLWIELEKIIPQLTPVFEAYMAEKN